MPVEAALSGGHFRASGVGGGFARRGLCFLSLETCFGMLARGWLDGKSGIQVIRMGLALEKELETAVLAGPAHSALG